MDLMTAIIASKLAGLNPSGGGGVSSWNDLTDKPFGIEEKEIVYIEETTAVFEEAQSVVPATALFVSGDTYTVMWDGQKYECVAIGEDSSAAIGNLGAFDEGFENTGEPFILLAEETADGVMCAIVDVGGTGADTHTVSVFGIGKIVHKLDDVFLDTSVPVFDLGNAGMSAVYPGTACSVGMDATKIFEVSKKGRPVVFRFLFKLNSAGAEIQIGVLAHLMDLVSGDVVSGYAFGFAGDGLRIFEIRCYKDQCFVSCDTVTLAT